MPFCLIPAIVCHVEALLWAHRLPLRGRHSLFGQDGVGASVVGEDVGAGGCGGVVGVGVVDLDIVDGGRLAGGIQEVVGAPTMALLATGPRNNAVARKPMTSPAW